MPKSALNKEKIIEEAMVDDMFHAWLLVAAAILDLNLIPASDIQALCDETRALADKDASTEALEHADRLMGIPPAPKLNIGRVKSYVELEKFKKKVQQISLRTSLAVICTGLERTGKFSEEDLHRIFLSADLTQAEIDAGTNSYDNLENQLLTKMVSIELAEDA